MKRRILYLQYTNPAAYPPLLHSSGILAEQGWDVLFVGIAAQGANAFVIPAHPRIDFQQIGGRSGGAFGRAKYTAFALRSLLAAARFRPDWCYASDPLSTPAAAAIRTALRTKLLYHEHDAPSVGAQLPAIVQKHRARVAATAAVVVAPSAQRLELVPPGRGRRFVVWNCPRRSEARITAERQTGGRFRLVYHGSLSRDRLTPEFIDALRMLPASVELDIFGYETEGHRGYVQELLQRAAAAGIESRVRYHGSIPERAELLRRLRGFQLGISTVAATAVDRNLDTLAGASNKAFEYLALGIPLLISRDPAWQQLYQEPGYAVDCVPTDANSIAAAVRAITAQPERAREMGELGRMRVLTEWNYETQFAPVLEVLTS